MSTTAKGAARVGAIMTALDAAGFRCARVSASGQRRGARRAERCLAGDVLALATCPTLPHLLVEIGGSGKRLGVAFAELRDSLAPGFCPLVVRFVERRRYVYCDEDSRFNSLGDALDALRSGAAS